LFKNVASQKFIVFAFDATTNVPKTGDAANITAYVSKDFGTVTVLGDTSATEMDATNAPGYYLFDATQGETNGDCLLVSAKSSTANIKVLGAPATIFTYPTTGILAPATSGRTLVVDASGLADANMVKMGPTGSGTAQTARDVGASVLLSAGTGTGQLDFTSGVVKANVTQFGGSAGTFASGRPEVNATHFAGTISAGTAGYVGLDWGHVTAQSTAVNLSGTTVNLCNTITTYTGNTVQTGDSYARIGAAGASLTSVGLAATQTFSNTGTWTGNLTGSVGSVTGLTASNLDATVSSRLATASYTAPPSAASNATAVLTTQMTESYAADGTAPTLAQALMLIQQILSESSVATTTLTVKKLDGSTSAATFTLNSSTAPTSITRTT